MHRVTLMPSGHAFEVPAGRSILLAAIDAGLGLPYSCKTGICRTCRGRVLAGEVDAGDVHPDYLSASERAAGHALLCRAVPLTDCTVEVREIDHAAGMRPKILPCRVLAIDRLAADVARLRVRLPMNEPLSYLPGQYVDFLLADGQRRSYSMAHAPAAGGAIELVFHVRHSPGGLFTDHVFGALKPRDLLRFEGPFGSFCLREDSTRPIVMVASGTGFAPIQAMIEYALAKGIQAARPIALYWGGRTRADLYAAEVPAQWAMEYPGVRFVPVLSEPTAACKWPGRTGLVHLAVMADFPDLSGAQVYACGAPVMVDAARRDFIAQCGLPPNEFLADAFVSEAERRGSSR